MGNISPVEPLRQHLNSLPPSEQSAFAERCGTTIGYLRKALSTGSVLRPELMVAIERESGRLVRRWDMRPTDWHLVWPELVNTEGAPPVEAAA
jgi:DNA-binding transcriptional regulator YdaS (Cro superfamily)